MLIRRWTGGGEEEEEERREEKKGEARRHCPPSLAEDLITRMIFKGWMSFIPKADGDTL